MQKMSGSQRESRIDVVYKMKMTAISNIMGAGAARDHLPVIPQLASNWWTPPSTPCPRVTKHIHHVYKKLSN